MAPQSAGGGAPRAVATAVAAGLALWGALAVLGGERFQRGRPQRASVRVPASLAGAHAATPPDTELQGIERDSAALKEDERLQTAPAAALPASTAAPASPPPPAERALLRRAAAVGRRPSGASAPPPPGHAANDATALTQTLWQTMDTKSYGNARIRAIMATWDRLNPHLDHRVQNDDEADRFMRDMFSDEVYQVYSRMDLPVMKADMWRYAIMYARGGVYADADAECLKPIPEWWNPNECGAVVGLENDVHMCQWAFASAPRHPLFARVLNIIVDKVQAYRAEYGADARLADHSNEHFVHTFSGPGVFTDAVRSLYKLADLPKPGTVATPVGGSSSSSIGSSSRNGSEPVSTVCFRDRRFFSEFAVRNHYGSQWVDASQSWIQQARWQSKAEIRKSLCARKGGVGHSYGHQCGVEYCCGVCTGERECRGKLSCACLDGELDK